MKVELDLKAKEAIENILRRGNDVKIRRNKDSFVIIEEKQTIKYRPS